MSTVLLLKGGCLCGAVEYEVADAFRYAWNCHCSDCRRATGSAFKPFGGIERERLRLVRGEDRVSIFGNPQENHDIHCGACGSLLFSVVEGGKIHVTLGTLHGAPSIRPQGHLFVGDKAPWFEILDGLPQYEGYPPS